MSLAIGLTTLYGLIGTKASAAGLMIKPRLTSYAPGSYIVFSGDIADHSNFMAHSRV
jgi:hypothetical protein